MIALIPSRRSCVASTTPDNHVKMHGQQVFLQMGWRLCGSKNSSASPSSFIFKESHSLPGNPFNNITTKSISYSDSCDIADHDSNSSKCPCLLHHLILIVMLHSYLLHRHQLPWFVNNKFGIENIE